MAMPLMVKEFTWRQSPDAIYLTVKIPGIRRDKASFVTCDNYIRLHHHPHYFEVFLWAEVDDGLGKCTLDENTGVAVFEMPKLSPGLDWARLDVPDLGRAEKHEKRVRAVEESQRRSKAEIEAAFARRHDQRQMTIHEQLRLDEEARARIASVKGFQARSLLQEFQERMMAPAPDGPQSKTDDEDGDGDGHRGPAPNPSTKPKSTEPNRTIWSNQEIRKTGDGAVPPAAPVPIRAPQKIAVIFTPRDFPTPTRESTAAEEEEWLKKQAEARRTSGFQDADLRPEERNPTWLYEKGESLFECGSFMGAISAYSTGLKLAPKMPELLAGRAGAHLALSNVRKAIEDSSQALDLLTPKVAANEGDRFRCHVTRGTGFLKLSMKREALLDFQAAARLQPNNEELKDQVIQIQAALDKAEIYGDSSSDGD